MDPRQRIQRCATLGCHLRLAVGAPVDRAAEGDDRIRAGDVPAGTYATVTHFGHPDGIEETNDRLERWIQDRGVKVAGPHENGAFIFEGRFELFGTGPRSNRIPRNGRPRSHTCSKPTKLERDEL